MSTEFLTAATAAIASLTRDDSKSTTDFCKRLREPLRWRQTFGRVSKYLDAAGSPDFASMRANTINRGIASIWEWSRTCRAPCSGSSQINAVSVTSERSI